ncbi:MAG: phytanoyl-CoA dioxygenase family protein, partial [Opitutales bacterium]|nr:phytanoyl-CoA dioxygenase family protein [Opitutales bacterium]
VMVAVDPATEENGCLQVLQGSHKMGRINHVLTGDQAGADMEYVEPAMDRFPLAHCRLSPGDAVFFHPNLLHCSAANRSDNARWALICCYNTKRNSPFKESHHPAYTPLHKVDDSQIIEVGQDHTKRTSVEYANLDSDDRSAKSLPENQ